MIYGLVQSKCNIAFNLAASMYVYGKRFYDMYWDMVLRLVLLWFKLVGFEIVQIFISRFLQDLMN